MVTCDFQLLLKYLLEHGKAMQEHLQKCVADGVIAKWAVPEHYVFVEELPRTSVGKIDKKALRSRHQTGDLR